MRIGFSGVRGSVSKRRLILGMLLAGLAISQAPASDVKAPTSTVTPLRLISSDDRSVRLEVELAESDFVVDADDEGRTLVHVPGWPLAVTPGHPELPVLVVPVGVPLDAEVRLTVIRHETERQASEPPRPVAQFDEKSGRYVRREDPGVYGRDGVWPVTPVELDVARYREQTLARLLIHPARFDAQTGEIVYTRRLDIRLDFDGGRGFLAHDPRTPDLLRPHLINREAVERWSLPRAQSEEVAPKAASATSGAATPGLKISFDRRGIVRVGRTELETAGFDPAGIDPRNLQLSFRGTPVPCRITGEDDGVFDPGDAVEFFAVPNEGRFTTTHVYWLAVGDLPGLRFSERSAAPAAAPLAQRFLDVLRLEEGNGFYEPGRPASEGDPHFFWALFEDNPFGDGITQLDQPMNLIGVDPVGTARIRGLFSGRSSLIGSPDHQAVFTVNGTEVGQTIWDSFLFQQADVPFDAELLVPGSNTLRITQPPLPGDKYYLDWITVEYPRLTQALDDRLIVNRPDGSNLRYEVSGFVGAADPLVLDVTDPFAPVRLTDVAVVGAGPFAIGFEDPEPGPRSYALAGDGGREVATALELDVPSSLRDFDGGADQIIIVPEGWEASLQPLVDHRRSRGWRVEMVNLTDVADEFAGGNVDDVAIRDFVQYAYFNWAPPAVRFLLLVGEANLDPQNHLARDPHYHVMPIHMGVTSAMGETATDTWFGAVAGSDLLPDVGVGRLSVRTPADAANLAGKLVTYETEWAGNEAWVRKVMHVAGNEQPFEASLGRAAVHLTPIYSLFNEFRRAGADAETIKSRYVTGVSMSSYIGHGNVTFWADADTGPFFRDSHVQQITNAGKLPFATALNCLNGMIADPERIDSLAEVFNNRPAPKGALAVWTTSALGFLSEYDPLQEILYRTIFQDNHRDLGTATTASMVETWSTQPVSIDLVKKMVLVGDPASRMHFRCENGTNVFDVTCNGIDDDCDGMVDDDFVGEATSCGSGECATTGETRCENGVVVDTCQAGNNAPDDPTCDGIDDDCDGLFDEDFVGNEITCGTGACEAVGELICAGAQLVPSCQPGNPAPLDDTCDGIDDDCDGFADEEFASEITTCGEGVCQSNGESLCLAGTIEDNCIAGTPGPDDASCNGLDDDCDGAVDEEFPTVPTECGVGACSAVGEMACLGGTVQDTCEPGAPAASDATCDGVDDDCDGLQDEEFVSASTTCGVGACEANGVSDCNDGVPSDSCQPGKPSEETCGNGVDEDCDGLVDEADAVDARLWYADLDGDGFGDPFGAVLACLPPNGFVADSTDCNDSDATAWAAPGEVQALIFATSTSFEWQLPAEPGSPADTWILRSTAPEDFVGAASCLTPASATEGTDGELPPPGSVWHYLVGMANGCADGVAALGSGSSGASRTGRICP